MRKLKRNIKIQNNENEIKKILETENADFLIEMGKSLYFEGIKKEAEKYFEKACEKSQNIEDVIEIATFYKNNEEYEKAEKYFEKGIYLENKNDYEKMGNLYFQKGDYKRALEILEKVENKDELIKSRMAAIYMELEDYEKAEKLYLEAYEEFQEKDIKYIIAMELYNLYMNEENFDEMERWFSKTNLKYDVDYYTVIGDYYRSLTENERAEKWYLKKYEETGDINDKIYLADFYNEIDKYEKAEKLYMEAMYETEMGFSPVFIGLGKICEKQKKYEEAEKNYLKGIKLASLVSIVNLYDLYKERGLENDLQYEIEKLLKLIANNVEKLLFFEEDCTEKLQKMFHNEKNYIMMIRKMRREIKKYIKK